MQRRVGVLGEPWPGDMRERVQCEAVEGPEEGVEEDDGGEEEDERVGKERVGMEVSSIVEVWQVCEGGSVRSVATACIGAGGCTRARRLRKRPFFPVVVLNTYVYGDAT